MGSFSSRRWLLFAAALALAASAARLHCSVVSSMQTSILFEDHPNFSRDGRRDANEDERDRDDYEPYVGRWHRRFASRSGYVFFKHVRKAAGSMIRQFLFSVLDRHGYRGLGQFLEGADREEAERHFPFLNVEQRERAARYYAERENATNYNATNATKATRRKNRVYYIEQEFSTMDWRCRDADPRWNDSLSVIVLRHPVERHLSEFFYSGPPAEGEFLGVKFGKIGGIARRLKIDRKQLYANKTYTSALSTFVEENLREWSTNRTGEKFNYFKWYLSPRYLDNFQLRSLAGCASGECFEGKDIDPDKLARIALDGPRNDSSPIDSVCTMHPFYPMKVDGLVACSKRPEVCPSDCDGPCFYKAAAWGTVDERDLVRAVRSLEGFDVVLLAETLDDGDQLALLSDVMGVPRNTSQSIKKKNINMVKKNRRERTHYYRDLISNLTHPRMLDPLTAENSLDIELYKHAVRLNRRMTERWKREVRWRDGKEEAREEGEYGRDDNKNNYTGSKNASLER